MKATVKNWLKRGAFLAVTGVGLMPLTAQAHEHVDIVIRGHEPVFPPDVQAMQIWVGPVYRTVSDRVWVDPVYRTVCEDVLVPERCETTERVIYEHGRRITRIERVIIPAHTEGVEHRVCITEGHFDCVEHNVLVCAGHYETVSAPIRVMRPFGVSVHS